MTPPSWAWLLVAVPLCGCADTRREAPLRSPSRDYRPPPPTTSDGQVVGADRVAPGDRLEEGPRARDGLDLAPGWKGG